MSPKKKRSPSKRSLEWVAASGGPFSDEDAAIIGRELVKIAASNGVEDVRSLDKRIVFDAVAKNPKHPLRPYVFNSSDEDAARSHRLERCALLIRSVRLVSNEVGEIPRPMPAFIYDPQHASREQGDSLNKRRGHVMTVDAMRNDPTWVSALTGQVRIVISTVERLELLVSMRKAPVQIAVLAKSLRTAIDTHMRAVDSAAE